MKNIVKVVLIALLWITLIDQGIFGSNGDTTLRLQMSHAWWTGTEEVLLPPNFHLPPERGRGYINVGVKGADGRRYILYDVGQSMLMLPGDWLGGQLHQWFPEISSEHLRQLTVSFLIFVPLNVAVVASCFWLLRLFDFNKQMAALASITWLLSTTVLHYAQIHFQNNQVLLFAILGYATALAYVRSAKPKFAVLSGLALGAALLVRITSIIHVFTVFLFLVGCLFYQNRDYRKVIKPIGLWILGFLPLAMLGRVFDYIRYGSLWTTGQSLQFKAYHDHTDPIWAGLPDFPANYPLTQNPIHGFLAVLFAPSKSIFIYDPLLLPCLILGILLWKRLSPYIQLYLIAGVFNLVLHMVLTCRLDFWGGEWSWGARYHVTSLHLLLIPLVALFLQRLLRSRRLTSWVMSGILAIAVTVQLASVTLPYALEIAKPEFMTSNSSLLTRLGQRSRLGQRFTNLACLINSSFSEVCINESNLSQLKPDERTEVEKYNRLAFLPFQLDQIVPNPDLRAKFSIFTFAVWVVISILAIGSTIYFFYRSWVLLRAGRI